MICIFSDGSQEFDSNGVGVLTPSSCLVKEEAGGIYELTLTHPMDARGKYTYIDYGCVLRVPVPARLTPQIQLMSVNERVVYKVAITTAWAVGYARVYTKPTTSSKVLAYHRNNDEVTFLEQVPDVTWARVIDGNGVTGYMSTLNITYVRTEAGTPGETIQAHPVRDQLFRIYRVVKDTEAQTVTAYARHIYYDQLTNVLISCNIADQTVQQALAAQSAACVQTHDFSYYSDDSTTKITQDYSLKNAVEAQLDPEIGLLTKANLKLLRDNFDVYLMKTAGIARAGALLYANNLLGVSVDVNEDSLCNRIVPVGQTKDGEPLLIDAVYVDSPNNTAGTRIRSKAINYDVKVGEKDPEGVDYTTASAKAMLAELALADFAAGLDGAELSMTVDFVLLGDTEEFKQYRELDRLYLYDTVPVIDSLHGVAVTAEVTGYEFDSLTGRYTKVTIGVTGGAASVGSIAGYEISAGSISGTRLINGAIGPAQLCNGAVNSLKIGTAAIQTAHIQDAAIVSAKIQDAAIETAKIKDAAIETAKIKDAAIETAKIKDAAIVSAKIQDAAITNAHISNAGIDFAKIKDLVAGTAIFSLGVNDELYVNRLYVTAANIAHLEVGDLLFKDANGAFWKIGVDENGNVVTTAVSVEYQNISNAALLNVSEYVVVRSTTAPAAPYVGQLWMNTSTNIIKRCTAVTPSVVWTPVAANELHTSYINAVETGLQILSSGLIEVMAGGGIKFQTGAELLVEAGRALFKTDDFSVLDSTGARTVMFLGKNEADDYVANFDVDMLSADHIASDVLNTFVGGTIPWKGNPQASLDAIGKHLLADSTLTVPAGTHVGNLLIAGFKGAMLRINFSSGAIISGTIRAFFNDYLYLYAAAVDTAYITPRASGSYGVYVLASKYFYAYKINVSGFTPASGTRASGNGTDVGIQAVASNCMLVNCCIDKTCTMALQASGPSRLYMENCFGGVAGGSDPATVANLGYGVRAMYGAAVYMHATTFASVSGDAAYRAPAIGTSGALTATGSTGTTPAAPGVVDYVYNDSKYNETYDDTWNPFTTDMAVWSTGVPRSGLADAAYKQYCGMWRCKLDGGSVQNMITGLSGKTIVSALLTVHCDMCPAGSATKNLYYLHTNGLPVGGTSGSDYLTDTGVDFVAANGADTVIDITAWLAARVSAGTAFYGFGLDYNGRYARFTSLCSLQIQYTG